MVLTFGDGLELDPALFELRRYGTNVRMEPQAFDVLTYLVSHRDRVVAKEELMDAVWGGRFVTEAAVTSRIKQARRALGDDGRDQRLIRTVHGRGYRFIAPVAAPQPESAAGGSDRSATDPAQGVATPPAQLTGASTDAADRDGSDGETSDGDEPARSGATAPIRYTISDGLHIAYQVTGSGDTDIVLISGFVSHLELDWSDSRHAHFLDRLGTMGRLIRFDKRGTGMSDRPPGVPDLETRMHDVLAVMDATSSRRAVLCGYSEGGPMAILFAATHPERVSSLVLYGSYAKRTWAEDYPWAQTDEERSRYTELLVSGWDWEADFRMRCPSADAAMQRWWAQRMRAAATPSTVRALMDMNSAVDVRDALSAVRVPTLVLHRTGDALFHAEEARYLADNIPGAQLQLLDGQDHFVSGDPDQLLDAVEPFVAADRKAPQEPLALAAVAAVSGRDADEVVAALVAAGGRRRIDSSGRSLVLFDGPATAVRSGLAHLGPGVSLGLAIAEVPRTDPQVDGPGVRLAAAVADSATPGQLWLSATAGVLLAGSGVGLEPAGTYEGVEGAQQLLRAVRG